MGLEGGRSPLTSAIINRQRAAQILLGLLILLLFIQTLGRAASPLGSDLASFLESSRALWHGRNPYETSSPFPYLYPLFLAFVLLPLTWIPLWLATTLWFAANMAALLYACRTTARLVLPGPQAGPLTAWGVPAFLLFALMFDTIQSQFVNSQVNGLVLGGCVLCLGSLVDGRKTLAAVLLAAAIAVKLVPLLLVVFLLVRREFRASAIAVVCAAVFCLGPAVLLGDQGVPILVSYMRAIVVEGAFLSREAFGHPATYSLAGFVSFLAPATASLPWLKPVCGLAVIGGVVGLELWRPAVDPIDDRSAFVRRFSVFLAAMLLVTPMSEPHHQLLLIPGVIVVGLGMADDTRGLSRYEAGGLLLFFLLLYAGKFVAASPFAFLAVTMLCVLLEAGGRRPAAP